MSFCNTFELRDSVQPTDMSNPVQWRSEENLANFKAQFL